MPAKIFKDWSKRPSDLEKESEEYKTYYFVCEGLNTEYRYVDELISILKSKRYKNKIELVNVRKTGKDKGCTDLKSLINFSIKEIHDKIDDFIDDLDRIILVFDTDIYKDNQSSYLDAKKNMKNYHVLAISNPCFELYLLLHIENAYTNIVKPNYNKILTNDYVNKSRKYLDKLVSQYFNINPKTNHKVGRIAKNYTTAIKEEKNINESCDNCLDKLSCNVGKIIESIISNNLL